MQVAAQLENGILSDKAFQFGQKILGQQHFLALMGKPRTPRGKVPSASFTGNGKLKRRTRPFQIGLKQTLAQRACAAVKMFCQNAEPTLHALRACTTAVPSSFRSTSRTLRRPYSVSASPSFSSSTENVCGKAHNAAVSDRAFNNRLIGRSMPSETGAGKSGSHFPNRCSISFPIFIPRLFLPTPSIPLRENRLSDGIADSSGCLGRRVRRGCRGCG